MPSKRLQSLKQPIAQQGEKASCWFEPLTRLSRDFSVGGVSKPKIFFGEPNIYY
jgi:hypothetical protein